MIAINHDITAPPRLTRKPGNRPHVISFVGKGGAGKTTTAIQLGAIAKEAGHSVLIVDADRQASLSSWTFVRGKGDISVKPCHPEQVLEHISRASVSGIDLVLVDNAPNENACSEKIAQSADLTLVMTRASLFDLRVALSWLDLCRRHGAPVGVVINDAPSSRSGIEAPMVRDARGVLRDATGRTWGGQITRRHAVIDVTARGRSIVEMTPTGPAAAEYRRLWSATVNLLKMRS